MRRLALLGLLMALPFVAVPLVWAATNGGVRGASLSEFRSAGFVASPQAPPQPVESAAASVRRVSFFVTGPAGVEVTIRQASGRVVRRLGHFTVPVRQRLVLAWDGRGLPAGKYAAVIAARGVTSRAPFEVRRLRDADDADRQSLREPGNA